MTTDSDKVQESSDDAKKKKQSPVAPKTKITVDKAPAPPAAPEPQVVEPPVAEPPPPVEKPPSAIIEPPAVTSPLVAEPAPVVPSEVKEKKPVVFRSVRKEFTCCYIEAKSATIAGVVVERQPAVTIRFKEHTFTTVDEKKIAFLRKLIDSGGTDSTEIFEMPEVDELLHGNVAERLEKMSLSELRQVAGERGVSVLPTDGEIEMQYKLLKKLLGAG